MMISSFDERSTDVEEHERRAAVILDAMYQFVALLDPRGDILEVNRAALAGAGHQIQEIRGKPFWTARWWQVSEQVRSDLQAAIQRAAAGQFVRYEVVIYGEQSGLAPITIDFSLQPIQGESGEVEYLLAEGRNITERKRAEEQVARQAQELRDLNERLKELDRLDAVQSRQRVETLNLQLRAEITERERAEQANRQAASIIETSDDAIVSKDLNGVIRTWNRGAERLFGYKAEEVIGKPITILIPPDRHDEEPGILERIRRGERVEHYETVRMRKDGSLIDISLSVSPVKDADGMIVGASKIAHDITDRRRSQELQTLLLREMSHRVKNLFAVTSSMVALSARSARTPSDMAQSVQGRLRALTHAHELTRPGLIDSSGQASQPTTLHRLLQQILAPYLDLECSGDRATIEGPDVPVAGSAVTSLALILHEFTTNAAKYGALSSPTGSVQIRCSIDGGQLLLLWQERGGPSLDGDPDKEGFGTVLTRRIVVDNFGGELTNDWQTKGLVIHLSVPLARLTM